MPHLPTTRKERQVADLERKVERLQRDQRFQRLRTRPARRGLVVLGAIFLVGIIPAYTQSGVIAGTLVTAAAWLMWWLLRISVRTVADLPDRFLDERQRMQRDRAYLDAFRIYATIVSSVVTIALIAFVLVEENDKVTLTTTWVQAFGLVISLITLPLILPSMVVAWWDKGEELSEPAISEENDAQPE
ncbi:MAG: hypothetical protein NWQ96_08715 [Candidatus Nanopelagicales bacterium]|jgi:hypothetical protein|nr:hypothetical protein [Candidatus Nanopelagicales bacterium]